eukprot:TRINITY_DN557_c2_g2_i1.p1 TRINITY_DN557_c2_g2~~TRINITY_DN557_c2_g2_i1.p1  ORF type:complete len:371 (+),score=42.71 TRINITY_DN557_c2_g2_i1:105-1217(+)
MRARALPAPGGSGHLNLILVLLSCLACFYTGGRLWQDAKVRRDLMEWAAKRDKPGMAINSVEDSIKFLDHKALEKKVASLEMEMAAARAKGFVSDTMYVENNGTGGGERLLAVIGINTGFGHQDRRDSIRSTWMSAAGSPEKLESLKRVVIRFVVGHSANRGDSSDKLIEVENRLHNDFLILQDHVEGYDELPIKTQIYFSTIITLWDADFYLKVDDDVYVNVDRLSEMLATHSHKTRVYVGCMKSGEVYTETSQRWHEPEWWKFGDAKYYFRHATGQVYGLSKALAHYISINREILHRYRNEDVSLGSWMIGLEVEHADERRLCCASPPATDCEKRRSEGAGCIAVFDWGCSGLCQSVERMKVVHKACG